MAYIDKSHSQSTFPSFILFQTHFLSTYYIKDIAFSNKVQTNKTVHQKPTFALGKRKTRQALQCDEKRAVRK